MTTTVKVHVNGQYRATITERWPHYVHYRGRGKPVHCPPDTFGFIGKPGPSDCDWIVPGTLDLGR